MTTQEFDIEWAKRRITGAKKDLEDHKALPKKEQSELVIRILKNTVNELEAIAQGVISKKRLWGSK